MLNMSMVAIAITASGNMIMENGTTHEAAPN